MKDTYEKAIFAAGCFWGVQYYIDQIEGVIFTEVGYTGGSTVNPTYEAVCYEKTGHAEAIRVIFDPSVIAYDTLLKHFFRLHDPTQVDRQGPDVGDQYRSAIFYTNELQKTAAENTRAQIAQEKGIIVATKITEAGEFYPAEEHHQKYTEKTGRGMCHVPYSKLP
jgi:peptide methionine sulfoxide reductase msrA/msrB